MSTWLFALAIIGVVAAVGWRKWSRARLARRIESLPGRQPSTAIAATSFRQMDELARDIPCRCGGRTTVMGERTEYFDGHELRVLRTECLRCEEVTWLYFDLSTLPH